MTTDEMPEIRRYEVVDTDLLRFDSEDCQAPKCSLWQCHSGPHAEIHPLSGRVFDTWGDGENYFSAENVSDDAMRVINRINTLRDEAIEAIEAADSYKYEVERKYPDLTFDQDPILYGMLHSRDLWPTEGHLTFSGTEDSSEQAIREELVEMFGNNEGDE